MMVDQYQRQIKTNWNKFAVSNIPLRYLIGIEVYRRQQN